VARFLALAVLAFLLFLIIRASVYSFLGGFRGAARPRPTRRGRGLDELVKDPVCETYIPRRKAISRGSGPALQYFCSAACADKYATRS
jgi:YHS domain-containing protein